MEIFDGYYYKNCKWFLKSIGLWPYQAQFKRISNYIIFYMINLSLTIPQLIMLIKNWRDFSVLIENSVSIMFAIVTMSKFSVTFSSAQQLNLVFLQITKDWKAFEDKVERKILEKNTEQGRVLVLVYTFYLLFAWITYTFMPFTPYFLDKLFPLQNGTRSLLLPFYADYILFDQIDYHYWCCGHIAIVYFTSFLLYSGVDGAYVMTVKHVCGLFEITCYRMKTIGITHKIDEGYDYSTNYLTTKQEMKRAVILHNETIRCVSLLEDSFSKCFLIVQGLCVFGLSLLLVYTTTLVDLFKLIRLIAFLIGIVIHLYYLNWVGQQIIDCSSKVFNCAYSSKWYDISVKSRIVIEIIMCCSLNDCELTAGKISSLSMQSFGILMKTTVSYFTVFLSVT